jgi:LmbE family N-acetylglucosaminyl deacetylase
MRLSADRSLKAMGAPNGGIDGTLLISSHPDDVALSVGGSIAKGFFPEPLLLVTVFSRGGTAIHYGGARKAGIDSMRAEEDMEFATAIGARLLQFGLADASASMSPGPEFNSIRWVSSVTRSMTTRRSPLSQGGLLVGVEAGLESLTRTVPRALKWSFLPELSRLDRGYSEMKYKLSTLISRFPGFVVACPLALGLHPDHILVNTACRDAVGRDLLWFYEDLPYASAYRPSGILRHVAQIRADLRPVYVDFEDKKGVKLGNLRIYASQVGPSDYRKVMRYAETVIPGGRAHERIWMPRTLAEKAHTLEAEGPLGAHSSMPDTGFSSSGTPA